MEISCTGQRGHPCTRATLGEPTFSTFPYKTWPNRLHEKLKLGLARRVARLAGSRFCDGRVTLLSGQVFLHINTLVRSGGSTRSGLVCYTATLKTAV